MANFPGSAPSIPSATGSETLATAAGIGHTALHNLLAGEITAVAAKLGTGSSTPSNGAFLVGNGSGTSGWRAATSSDVGLGNVDNTSDATKNAAVATLSNKTLTTPTIASFANATHDHSNAAGGGTLNAATALISGSVTPDELFSGAGASWAWQSWSPTLTNITVGSGSTTSYLYIQVGKIVFFRLLIILGTSGASVGAGVQFTLPVTAASNYSQYNSRLGNCGFRDASAATTYEGVLDYLSTTVVEMAICNVGGTYPVQTAVTSTVPFTWAASDIFAAQGFYEAA